MNARDALREAFTAYAAEYSEDSDTFVDFVVAQLCEVEPPNAQGLIDWYREHADVMERILEPEKPIEAPARRLEDVRPFTSRRTETVACAVCGVRDVAQVHTFEAGGAVYVWISPPAHWWVLLAAFEARLRCPRCLPDPRVLTTPRERRLPKTTARERARRRRKDGDE